MVVAQEAGSFLSRLVPLFVALAIGIPIGILILAVGRAKSGRLGSFRPSGRSLKMKLPAAGQTAIQAVKRAGSSLNGYRLEDSENGKYLFSNSVIWFRVSHLDDDGDSSTWRVERQAKFGWADTVFGRQVNVALADFEQKLRTSVSRSLGRRE